MPEYAILTRNNEIQSVSFDAYIESIKQGDKIIHVGLNHIYDSTGTKVYISTVFLGMNHGYDKTDLWFETMVFDGINDSYQNRYSTFREAIEGHLKVFDACRAGIKLD